MNLLDDMLPRAACANDRAHRAGQADLALRSDKKKQSRL